MNEHRVELRLRKYIYMYPLFPYSWSNSKSFYKSRQDWCYRYCRRRSTCGKTLLIAIMRSWFLYCYWCTHLSLPYITSYYQLNPRRIFSQHCLVRLKKMSLPSTKSSLPSISMASISPSTFSTGIEPKISILGYWHIYYVSSTLVSHEVFPMLNYKGLSRRKSQAPKTQYVSYKYPRDGQTNNTDELTDQRESIKHKGPNDLTTSLHPETVKCRMMHAES